MRVGIIGGGTIARLFIEHVRRGELGRARIVAIAGRNERSRGRQLAGASRIPFVIGARALLAKKPDVVVEAASHDAESTISATPLRSSGSPYARKGRARN